MLRTLLFIALLSIVPWYAGSDDHINVITNKTVIQKEKTDNNSMSLRELIDIFTRKTIYWNDRTEIVVLTRKESSIQNQQFLLEVLGITPYQYRSRLQRNLYRGRATPPIEVDSEEEMLNLLLKHPEAIGYMYDYILYRNEKRLVIIQITTD